MNHRRHQTQHAARALEFIQSRPVVIEPVEQLRMDRIRRFDPALIFRLAGLGRKLLGVLAVLVRECLNDRVASGEEIGVPDRLEQSPADDLKALFRAGRAPGCFDPLDDVLQTLQRGQTTLAANLILRRGDAYHQ